MLAAKAPTFAAGGQGHIRTADVTAHSAAMLGAALVKAAVFAAGGQGHIRTAGVTAHSIATLGVLLPKAPRFSIGEQGPTWGAAPHPEVFTNKRRTGALRVCSDAKGNC